MYLYRKRRYRCQDCGKTFAEENPFIGKNQSKLGNQLKRFRSSCGIPIARMARLLGIAQGTYQEMESSANALPPSMEVAEKAASILSIDMETLWGDMDKLRKSMEEKRFVLEQRRLWKARRQEEKSEYDGSMKSLRKSLSRLSPAERTQLLRYWLLEANER